jgi:hypothetical protein
VINAASGPSMRSPTSCADTSRPGLIVERLETTYPAGDNVYFIGDEHGPDRIQLDTAAGGQPFFYIENGGRHQTSEAAEAAAIIRSWPEHSHPPTSPA